MHGASRFGSAVQGAGRHWYVPAALVAVGGGAMLLVSLWIYARTAAYRYPGPAAAPARHTAIVLGASVHRKGKPSDMLRDRLDTALELYRAGKVRKLLLTGDHGRRGYDEVTVMRKHVLQRGARPEDVFTDHAGFTTYESMARARALFGVESAIVVTQAFHLPRAVYLARGLGLPAVGVEADRHRYRTGVQQGVREAFARVKAFADLQLGRRAPLGGPRVDINGDGRVTWERDRRPPASQPR
jgi:vancomycin permeability regulator SanA